MSDTPIIVTATFDAPVETVWAAITEPDRMRQWFFEQIETFTAEEGFETRFDVPVDRRNFRHHWRVTEVSAPRSITYDWLYDGYSGGGEVTWDLDQTTSGTQLVLTCRGIETFPQDVPEFTPESCRAGWEYFIQTSLSSYLEEE